MPVMELATDGATTFTWNGYAGYGSDGSAGLAGWYDGDPFTAARAKLRRSDRVRVMELERDLVQGMLAVAGAIDDLLLSELKDKLAGNPLYGPALEAGRVDIMLLLIEDTHRSNTASINLKVPMSQNIYKMFTELQEMRLGDNIRKSATYVKTFNRKVEELHIAGYNKDRTAEANYLHAAVFMNGCLGNSQVANLHQRRGEGDVRLLCAPAMTLEVAQGLLLGWQDLVSATTSRVAGNGSASASAGASSSTVQEAVNQIGVGKKGKGKSMKCDFCPGSTNHWSQHCRASTTTDKMRAAAKAEYMAARSKKKKG